MQKMSKILKLLLLAGLSIGQISSIGPEEPIDIDPIHDGNKPTTEPTRGLTPEEIAQRAALRAKDQGSFNSQSKKIDTAIKAFDKKNSNKNANDINNLIANISTLESLPESLKTELLDNKIDSKSTSEDVASLQDILSKIDTYLKTGKLPESKPTTEPDKGDNTIGNPDESKTQPPSPLSPKESSFDTGSNPKTQEFTVENINDALQELGITDITNLTLADINKAFLKVAANDQGRYLKPTNEQTNAKNLLDDFVTTDKYDNNILNIRAELSWRSTSENPLSVQDIETGVTRIKDQFDNTSKTLDSTLTPEGKKTFYTYSKKFENLENKPTNLSKNSWLSKISALIKDFINNVLPKLKFKEKYQTESGDEGEEMIKEPLNITDEITVDELMNAFNRRKPR